jgi:hypothetical protein
MSNKDVYRHFHVVKAGEQLNKIIIDTFGYPRLTSMLDIIKHNNPVIAKNPDKLRIGQIIDITPSRHDLTNRITESQYMQIENSFKYLGTTGEAILMDAPDLVNNLEKTSDGSLVRVGDYARTLGQSAVKEGFVDLAKEAQRMSKIFEVALSRSAGFKNSREEFKENLRGFFKQPHIKNEFDTFSKNIKAWVLNGKYPGQGKMTTKSLKIPGAIKPNDIDRHVKRASQLKKTAKLGEKISGNYLSIFFGGWEIYKASPEDKVKVTFQQGGGILLGNAVAKAASHYACVTLLGALTVHVGGIGAIGCAAVSGGIAGYGASLLGEAIGEVLYDSIPKKP